MNHSGGSQKTATRSRNASSTGTTAAVDTAMGVSHNCSAAPEKKSCLERGSVMLFGFGENSRMTADKSASIAPFSETKADILRVSLSDRLTPLLISAGLVCGIIPLLMRDASGQLTLDSVLRPQAGANAEKPKADL